MGTIGKLCCGLIAAVTATVLSSLPAAAIIGGTLDSGNQFSNVGLITLNGQQWCTGTLYRTSPLKTSSNLFLTAGHCTRGYTGQFRVTFDPNGSSTALSFPGTAYTIPGFAYPARTNNSLNQYDVPDAGVIVLDRPVSGITPADLPSVGLLDTLDLKTQLLTTVGYGINDYSNANTYTTDGRNYIDVNIIPGQRTATSDLDLKTSSGACYGDSGGPSFLKGTKTIIGVTSWGQSIVCSDNNYIYPIDSAYGT